MIKLTDKAATQIQLRVHEECFASHMLSVIQVYMPSFCLKSNRSGLMLLNSIHVMYMISDLSHSLSSLYLCSAKQEGTERS